MQELLWTGLLSQGSLCGNENVHYFITNDPMLYELSDGLKKLDFSKHLEVLSNKTVMSYDENFGIVYISDGTYGFVYADGLGQGPINISGVGWSNGNFYSVAPEAIVTPPMECQTDIIDFGTRAVKTISYIAFGISVVGKLQVAVDYRYRTGETWYTTPWVNADANGDAQIMISGVDFRFRWKLSVWEYVEIPEIRVYGI